MEIIPLALGGPDLNIQGTALQEWFEAEIPAGWLTPGSKLAFEATGTLTQQSPGPVDLTLQFKFGPVAFAPETIAAISPTANSYRGAWFLRLVCDAYRGGGNGQHFTGLFGIGGEGSNALNLSSLNAVLPPRVIGPLGCALNTDIVPVEFCWMAGFSLDHPGVQWRVRSRSLVLTR